MSQSILVAGATGNLGQKIIHALLNNKADVRAVVRKEGNEDKIKALEKAGVQVFAVDMMHKDEVVQACEGVSCVVSALQGLHDVIIDTQKVLLEAVVEAGVPRFIPSNYSVDFTKLPPGGNRNFDLRREFHTYLDAASITPTSIFNGAFSYVLSVGTPLLDIKNKTVGYWDGKADWKIDFTTMENTAAFTACASLDNTTPAKLNIASFQISPNELFEIVNKNGKDEFKLINMGSLEAFAEQTKKMREANPKGENELYPQWQGAQYVHDMFSAHHELLDNNRYPDVTWTDKNEFIISIL